MNTSLPSPIAGTAADADLWAAAVAGDRPAFAGIVDRYQNLICSIAYCALGDFGRSEDLAQETFVAAWQNLASLQEPTKLRSWLCGIARRKLSNRRRQLSTDVAAHADSLEGDQLPSAALEQPIDRAIRGEEHDLVWNVLADLPENYREPLVLYYRSQQSVADVALQLELSEDAVRQRLARGRKRLKTEVAELVEKTLRASRPGTLFAAAVLAALPAAAPQAAAMGLAAAANATGGKAVAAVGLTALSGAILGPLLGLVGAALGVAAGNSSTRSTRERRFAIRVTLLVAALVATLLTTQAITFVWFPAAYRTLAFQVILWGSYLVLLISLIRWANNGLQHLRKEDGTASNLDRSFGDLGSAPLRAVTWSLAGMLVGGASWIIVAGQLAHDWLAPTIAFAVVAIAWFVLTRWLAASDTLSRRILALLWSVVVVAAIDVVIGSLRWSTWQSATPMHVANQLPLWAVNATVLSISASIAAYLLVLYRRARHVVSK